MDAREQAIHMIFDALGKVEAMNNLVPDDLLDEAGHKLYAAMNLLAEDMQSSVGGILKLENPYGDIDKWLKLRVQEWKDEAKTDLEREIIDELL